VEQLGEGFFMKLCDVVQFYSPLGGGVRRYLEDKMRFLAGRDNFEHLVIVPSHRDHVDCIYRTRMYEIKSLRLVGSFSYRMLLNRRRILSIVKEEKPALIEVGDAYRSAWIALEAGRRLRIPIVAFYHSDFPRALGRTIRRFCGQPVERILSRVMNRYIVNLYNRMHATVVASRRLQDVLTRCGIKRVVWIPLGTDVQVFKPNPAGREIRRELDLSQEDFLMLFVGRLAREKQIRNLIHMMEELTARPGKARRYHLLLVGDGELRDFVENTVQQRHDVTWLRYSDSTERLTAYYSAADLFVHAGTYETFGITSLEAQACGVRVLAVRSGGLDETVIGENPLIMAESASPADLAEGVRQCECVQNAQTPEERRERIARHFSITTTFERLTCLYQHILEGRPVEQFSYPGEEWNAHEYKCPAILTR